MAWSALPSGLGRHSGDWPRATWADVPVSCSAARLKRVMRPRGPTATTPLSMVSRTFRISSLTWTTRAWVCAFRTATAAWLASVVSRVGVVAEIRIARALGAEDQEADDFVFLDQRDDDFGLEPVKIVDQLISPIGWLRTYDLVSEHGLPVTVCRCYQE